jgi:CRP-like cAMP-binding protein
MARNLFRRDAVTELDLFAGCTPNQASQIRSLLTMLTVEPGTVLMRQGTYGFEFLLIAEGTAEVSLGGEVIATLGAGEFAGEMSLLGRTRRSATVTAVTPMKVYVANAAEFAGIEDVLPSVAARIAATAAEREAANRELVTAA